MAKTQRLIKLFGIQRSTHFTVLMCCAFFTQILISQNAYAQNAALPANTKVLLLPISGRTPTSAELCRAVEKKLRKRAKTEGVHLLPRAASTLAMGAAKRCHGDIACYADIGARAHAEVVISGEIVNRKGKSIRILLQTISVNDKALLGRAELEMDRVSHIDSQLARHAPALFKAFITHNDGAELALEELNLDVDPTIKTPAMQLEPLASAQNETPGINPQLPLVAPAVTQIQNKPLWSLWGGLTLMAAGTATAITGVLLMNRSEKFRKTANDTEELQTISRRAQKRGNELIATANVRFAMSGALALVAGGLLWLHFSSESRVPAALSQVDLSISPVGATIQLHW